MKRIFLILIFIMLTNINTKSQTTVLHFKRVKGINIDLKLSKNFIGYHVGYLYCLSDKFIFNQNLLYGQKTLEYTLGKQYLSESDILFIFFNKKNIYFNAISGFSLGWENLQSRVENENKNNFLFYYNIGLQTRYYYKNIGINITCRELLGNSKIDKSYLELGIGLTYMFTMSVNKKARKL